MSTARFAARLAPVRPFRARAARSLPTARMPDVASGAGILLVSAGVALVYLPAGLIVLGVLLLVFGAYAEGSAQ